MRDNDADRPPETDQGKVAEQYGAERMQQLSGGTTDAASETADDGAYGETRMAQLRGVGDSETETGPTDAEP